MKNFSDSIESLRKEITGAIVGLLGKHGLTELHFPDPNDCPDAPDTVYVIFYDDLGDPYECMVNCVSVEDGYISLTATDKIGGGVFTTESSYDLSVCNPIWLNDIYEAAFRLLEQTDSETTDET